MSKAANQQKSGKILNQGSHRSETYHGTRVPAAKGTDRFTVSEIKRAVDAAIDKNRSLFATRK